MASTDVQEITPLDSRLIEVRSATDWDVVGGRCEACGASFHPMRRYCAACFKETVKKLNLAKAGKITSCTTVFQVLPDVFPEPPYVLATIALPEGVTVKTVNAKGVDVEDLKIGQSVALELALMDEATGTRAAYVFRPVA